jgi:hypothetical protein
MGKGGHSSICKNLYAKGKSRLEAVGSEVDAACDFGGSVASPPFEISSDSISASNSAHPCSKVAPSIFDGRLIRLYRGLELIDLYFR